MRPLALAILLSILGGCLATISLAEIKIATGEWPPFTGERIKNQGFSTLITRRILDDAGLKYKIEFMPWKRCEKKVLGGSHLAAYPYAYTEERAAKYLYSEPIFFTQTMFFYHKRNAAKFQDFDFQGIADVRKMKLGGLRGYWYMDDFRKAGLEVAKVNNFDSIIPMLQKGRVELFPAVATVGWWNIATYCTKTKTCQKTDFGVVKNAFAKKENFFIISKKHPNAQEHLQKINAVIAKLQKAGEIEKLLQQFESEL